MIFYISNKVIGIWRKRIRRRTWI